MWYEHFKGKQIGYIKQTGVNKFVVEMCKVKVKSDIVWLVPIATSEETDYVGAYCELNDDPTIRIKFFAPFPLINQTSPMYLKRVLNNEYGNGFVLPV